MDRLEAQVGLHASRLCRGRSRLRQRLLTGALASVAVMGLAANVHAQASVTPTVPEPAADAGQVSEVVVTAQKRSQNIKDVPLSVTVLGGDHILQQHITDFTDLARNVPGLSFSNGGGSGLNNLALRGVSASAGGATVGVYLDDVSLGVPGRGAGATELKFFDIDHVEVLRGPQGTLYGAGSMGGTIRYITNQPKLDRFEGDLYTEVSGTKGGGTNYQVQGVVNLPLLTDKIALRVGAQQTRDSGYIDHVGVDGNVDHKNVNSETSTMVRASLLFQPIEQLKITPSVLYQRTKIDEDSVYFLDLPKFQENKLVAEKGLDKIFVPSLTMTGDLGWGDVTSVTSYYHRRFDRTFDGTEYNSEYLAYLLDISPTNTTGVDNSAVGNLPGPVYYAPNVSQWSEEFRVSSKSMAQTGRRYEWLGGVYFSDRKSQNRDDEYIPGLGALLTSLYGQDPAEVLGSPLPDDKVAYGYETRHTREIALFGEASLQLTKQLKLTVGGRQLFARDKVSVDQGLYFLQGLPEHYALQQKNQPFTPKFALSYAVTKDATLYATAVKGYRLGGPNSQVPLSICGADLADLGLSAAPATYKPDSLWSYEGGGKASLFGHRVTVGGAGYYIDWSSVQQGISLPNCGYGFTANAGKARVYGGELEVHARVTDNLTVSLSGALTDAELTKASAGVGATKGQDLLGVPKSTATVGLDYSRPITDSVQGFVRADYTYTGKSHGSYDTSDSDYDRPSYSTVNASLGATVNKVELSVFAKNLFNEDKTIQSPSVLFVSKGYTLYPRVVGVSLRAHF